MSQIVDVEDARQPIPNADGTIIITELPQGRAISVAPFVLAGVGGAGVAGGFKCVAAGAKIRVYLGLVNNIKPTNMTLGDATPLLLTPLGTSGYVVLRVTVSNDETGGNPDGIPDGDIVSAVVEIKTTAPPWDAEPLFYLALGTYSVGGGVLSVTPGGDGNGVGDQQFNLCGGLGGSPEFWRA